MMMKRLLTVPAAAALAVALGVGALPTTATAAPAKEHRGKAHAVKLKTTKAAKGTRSSQAGKAGKATRILEATRRKVLAQAARDDAALERVLVHAASLDAEAASRVAAAVEADLALVAELVTRARAAVSVVELAEVGAAVRGLRTEIYRIVVGQVQDLSDVSASVDELTTELAALDAEVAEREALGEDLAAVRAGLVEAAALVSAAGAGTPAAREAALLLTGLSSRGEVQLVTAEVERIQGLVVAAVELLTAARTALAAPVVEEPAEESPTTL